MIRTRAGAVLAAGLALLLSGCSQATSAPADAPPEKASITVTGLPIVDTAPLYLAQQEGLFKAQGLDVTIRTLPSSNQSLPGLADGSVDIAGGGNYVTFFGAQARKDADLRVVAEGALASPGLDQVVTRPNSGIDAPEQLAGRTIAVNTPPPNIQTLTLGRVLAARGVDPDSVKYVTMPFPQAVAALKAGTLDAAWLVEPFVTQAESDFGALPLIDPTSGPTGTFPLDGYFTTARFAEQYPATVRAFRRAISQASEMAADDQRVTGILPTYTTVSPTTAGIITLPDYPTTVQPARLQRVLDLMAQSGMLGQRLDATTLVTQ
ncbi:ABC transporter substrate-binding protein [Pseudonocardia endophytica]|uniref:NitT/TauT family transport system substrate-binding protein n=1 Tax=Pseudonocardia endophytica TaxID=401976 RepID=A0A4R1HXG9_PSEEN|nr:ABC transporter substrate-binding protein [Pseudonocardia endophytica]TCK26193.1 NitT/TauT family transport system substrate-binding protein [Pseudonocardia endophytica]